MEIWTLEHSSCEAAEAAIALERSFREVADWVDEHTRLPSQRTEKALYLRLYKWQKGTVVLPAHFRQEMDSWDLLPLRSLIAWVTEHGRLPKRHVAGCEDGLAQQLLKVTASLQRRPIVQREAIEAS